MTQGSYYGKESEGGRSGKPSLYGWAILIPFSSNPPFWFRKRSTQGSYFKAISGVFPYPNGSCKKIGFHIELQIYAIVDLQERRLWLNVHTWSTICTSYIHSRKLKQENFNCNPPVCCSQSHGVPDWRVCRLHDFPAAPQAFECWSSLGPAPRLYPGFSLVPPLGPLSYRARIFKQSGAEYIDEAVRGMKAHSLVLWNSLTSVEQKGFNLVKP